MPSGIEGHRVEASENWWTMEMIMFELKWNKTIVNSNTIDELMNDWDGGLRTIIWEKQVWKNRENWFKICGRVQAAKLVVQLTFAAPSQFDYAGNQPTNQPGPELIFAQNFYRISPTSCIPSNHSWFSTITLSLLILENSIKAHGNSFSRPYRQNQAKQNLLDRGVQ